MNKMVSVLVIISKFPSKEHPYITFLMNGLREYFHSICFFVFEKGDNEEGVHLLGKQAIRDFSNRTFYRFKYTKNIFKWIIPFCTIIIKIPKSTKCYFICRKNGHGIIQSIGQLMYNYKLIGGKSYDVVYINALQTARHFCIPAFFPNSKIIVSSRGQDIDIYPDKYNKIIPYIHKFHALGSHLKNNLILKGVLKENIITIPPAFLPAAQDQLYMSCKDDTWITIVSASRLTWTKGYVYALKAIERLVYHYNYTNIKYIIIGDGAEMEFILVEINRLKITDYVIIKGWLKQSEINQILLFADIYMLLSIEEGFNNSVLQAQAYSLPCVVSNAGGLPENVIDSVTGFVVPSFDSDLAADALYKLITDENLREKMGRNARNHALTNYQLEDQIKRYIKMIENV